VPQWAVATTPERLPRWALLVWRVRSGATCFEPGQVVDKNTPGRSDQLPGVRSTGPKTLGTLVGSLRPDAKSGTGIQFYGLGRFTPLRAAEGGTCGDPEDGAGLLVAHETYATRLDLGPSRAIVAGLAGPRVRRVALGGRALRLWGPSARSSTCGEAPGPSRSSSPTATAPRASSRSRPCARTADTLRAWACSASASRTASTARRA